MIVNLKPAAGSVKDNLDRAKSEMDRVILPEEGLAMT
jgi:hypothetical protein